MCFFVPHNPSLKLVHTRGFQGQLMCLARIGRQRRSFWYSGFLNNETRWDIVSDTINDLKHLTLVQDKFDQL